MQVTYICLNEIKGKKFDTLLPPLKMNKMKIVNLVYRIKKAKTAKRCVVDLLKKAYF